MKSIKRIRTFLTCALLTASVSIQPMDTPKKKKPKKTESAPLKIENWTKSVGDIILNPVSTKTQKKFSVILADNSFQKLDKKIKDIILASLNVCITSTTIDNASIAIKSLIKHSEQLNKLINAPGFSLSLIKYYSLRFNLGNETVAKKLQTEGTVKRLAQQEKIMLPIRNGLMPDSYAIKEMRTSDFDLYFTNEEQVPPAQECLLRGNVDALKMFLEAGVNPEHLLSDALWLKENTLTSHIDTIISILSDPVYQYRKHGNQSGE